MNLASGVLQISTLLGASLVARLLFDQMNRILLVPFPERLTRANFDLTDTALAMFVAQQGSVDTIIDFSHVSDDVDTSVIVARAYSPWPAQEKRQIFVVSSDVMEGVFRMYALHHEAAGFGTTQVVRSLDSALAVLGATAAGFDRVTAG